MTATRRDILKFAAGASGALLAASLPGRVHAAGDFPNRTIKIIVPSSAGGPQDIPARLASQFLPPKLGQAVVVENLAGGAGALAAREVVKASPDGYTLLSGGAGTVAVLPALSPTAGFDPTKDLAPVAMFMEAFQILAVHPSSPWTSARELFADLEANPDKISYSHPGKGSIPHLAGEMMRVRTGVDVESMAFKGGAESLRALLAGAVQITFENITILMPMIREGQVRALAVTSSTRSPFFPELPTMMEAGVPDYEVTTFFGLQAPAGTPTAIVQKLNSTINDALQTQEMQETITKIGGTVRPGSPDEFASTIAAHFTRWKALGKDAGITLG